MDGNGCSKFLDKTQAGLETDKDLFLQEAQQCSFNYDQALLDKDIMVTLQQTALRGNIVKLILNVKVVIMDMECLKCVFLIM